MTRSRHLPPQLRSRPLGLLGEAHAGVESVLAGARAAAWMRANDPERPRSDRARAALGLSPDLDHRPTETLR